MAKNPRKSGNPAKRAEALVSEVEPQSGEGKSGPNVFLLMVFTIVCSTAFFTLWYMWGFKGQVPSTALTMAGLTSGAVLIIALFLLRFVRAVAPMPNLRKTLALVLVLILAIGAALVALAQ